MEIRIQFPYGRVDVGLQNRLIRPLVIQLLRNNDIGRGQGTLEWEQIISSANTNELLCTAVPKNVGNLVQN